MKRRLFTFALAALTIGLLGSCSKINERIDGLDKRVYDLENTKIASVEQQIATINQSIADLSTIRTNIQTLMDAKTAMGEDITNLKAADQTLEGKINDLKTYVDTELAKYATKDWANATFATLTKQAEIITDVEKLKTDLAGLDTKLDQAIANLDSSLKGWVNEQLSGYYTIAQVDAKVDGIQSDIDALKTDNETNKTKIEELETSLTQLTQDLENAKTTIKAEYEKAIKDAIEGNDGYITETIKTAIATANGKLDDLTERVGTLETTVAALSGDVDALKAMIQTVSIIPAYNNGSVKAEDGILTINCVITPKEAVESLKKENFTILTSESEVLTKSALYGTLTIAKDEDLVLDKTNGTATIKVDVSSVLPTEEDKVLTVAVNVKNGISDFTTEFVPVTAAAAKPTVEYVEIGGLKWATMNLGAEKVTDYGDCFAWGEKAPYYEGTGGWPTTPTWKSGKESGYAWQSYCGSSSFSEWSTPPYDATTKILKPEFDAAAQIFGDGWRMPTKDDFTSLANACNDGGYTTGDITLDNSHKNISTAVGVTAKGIYFCNNYEAGDGIKGLLFHDGTNKLFFPAAGLGEGTSHSYDGISGRYWSSTWNNTGSAYLLLFSSSSVKPQKTDIRYYGYSVRPVKAEAKPLPAGALPGEFSVSAEGKKVRFSKGNLVATIDATGTPTAWKFAANQYDCLGEGGANKTIGQAAGDVDLFGWSTSTNGGTSTTDNYGIKTSTTVSDYSGDFYDWGKAVGDGSTWRTLSKDEWTYLFNNHSKKWATVNEVGGYVIAPDGFDGTLADSYADDAALAAAGNLVFLPAAGDRLGSYVRYVGDCGNYWSSTAYVENYAYYVYFDSSGVYPGSNDDRSYGFSVRLITESK